MVSGRWLCVAFGIWATAGGCAASYGFAGDGEAGIVERDAGLARLEFLHVEIARHDELYFKKAAPEISDADYDALKRELEMLRVRFPEEAARLAGAGSAVGDDRGAGWPKRRHRAPMLSLEKAYSEKELRAFDGAARKKLGRDEIAYVIEPKFDGLAISAVYEGGRLTRLVTRGNGEEGDDVTVNASTIRGLPRMLLAGSEAWALPVFVEVRGEVFLTFEEFERINAEREEAGEAEYASPRNLAAGRLKAIGRGADGARLDAVFYALGEVEPSAMTPASQADLLVRLAAWGLPTPERVVRAVSIGEAWRAVQALEVERMRLAYPIDGVVVKIDSAAMQREMGVSERAPRWAIAYKFAPERTTTRLKAITIQVGRTGVLTPVAELEPVTLGGATIARASLHNADEITRRDLRIGDFVVLERAGEIIPAIVGVERERRGSGSVPYVFPERCPACGEAAVRREGEAAWRCVNPRCAARVKRQVLHFASAQAVGIRGLGEATIAALVDDGKMRAVPDLYRLRRDDLLALERFGEGAAEGLLRSIDESRRAALWRFVHGLGVRGVGVVGAKAVARHFGGLDELTVASEREWSEVEGIGAETARALAEYFERGGGRETVRALIDAGVEPRASREVTDRLTGKRFVLTGKLPSLTREQAVHLIEEAGGVVTSAVSGLTDFVVVGENPGAAALEARERNVTVITEAELRALLDR